jgi:hypothetical protein
MLFLLPPLALFLLGLSWSIASPLGSSADEPFHAASIWCAWGESETCEIAENFSSVNVPGAISKSTCYVSWPAVAGAGCLNDFIETSPYNNKLVTVSQVSLNSTYSPAYFKLVRIFVGLDVENSIRAIRLFNVALGTLFFLWALVVSPNPIKRALSLSWGLAIIPVGIFFMASINPSSWLIFSIGTYWAFLATALARDTAKKQRIWSWIGAIFSGLIALGARTDAIIYLAIGTLAVLILRWRTISSHLNKSNIFLLVGLLGMVGGVGAWIFFRRFSIPNFGWGSDIASGGLPAPLKTVSELPAYFYGLFGGQGSYSEIKTGLDDAAGARTSGFVYGLGWVEFSLPAFIGIVGATSAIAVIFLMLRRLSINKSVTTLFLLVSFAGVVLLLRASVDFQNSSHVQPRYLYPLMLASLGIILIERVRRRPVLSKPQASILTALLIFSGSIAWLATATRYAVGPLGVLTDFGQPYEWWWHIGPGRLGWFIFTASVTSLWIYSTIWVWGRAKQSTQKPEHIEKMTP